MEEEEVEISVPGRPADTGLPADTDHFDVLLFVLLAIVLGAIAWSNVWLRRRAERQREQEEAQERPSR